MNFNKYFYVINYSEHEVELAKMEIEELLNITVYSKNFFSNKYVDVSRSPFIKEMISVIYEEESLEEIVNRVILNKLSYEDFKLIYVKGENDTTTYNERLESMKKIGFVINGIPNMKEPKIRLGISKVNGKWIFGEYASNNYEWHKHDKKPKNYSNSISTRMARALVNIAVGNDISKKVIDPCCGVGTVILEGISMGIDIKGSDINWSVIRSAKENLNYFNYPIVVKKCDIQVIETTYDVAIIDLPYGLFTPITVEEQYNIIHASRKIADKLLLVTFEDMDDIVERCGFKIVKKAKVTKGSLSRYISLCE